MKRTLPRRKLIVRQTLQGLLVRLTNITVVQWIMMDSFWATQLREEYFYISPVLNIWKTVLRLNLFLVIFSPQGGRGLGFRSPIEWLQIRNPRQNRWSAPFLSGTMMCDGFITCMLPIYTFDNIVLILWRKGNETMQNLNPVCGAS